MDYHTWKKSLDRHATVANSRWSAAKQLADAIVYLSQPDLFESDGERKQRMRALEQARANYRALCQK